ncbi:AAA domain-containing protein [Thomasclavelia spiroformis]|uniref:AAA domain-containing protein n=1 Tax=Thomasclavelia spiroformis TaxID=29348 RepID=UPI00241F152C|nr:AAA domain-containing protein [Thomasclavelia spiroformis]MBS6115929.1 ATP-binding protein [Thomasclavelia spiroformis]
MSKKSDVLESWIMVEHLSEGDINLNDKSIITLSNLEDENYYELFIREIQKKKMKKYQQGGIVVFFDIFSFKEIIDFLRKEYNLLETEEDIKVGNKFSFALYFDKELKIHSEMTFLTESFYIRKYRKIPRELEFSSFEQEYRKIFDEIFECPDEVDYMDHFNSAIKLIIKNNGIDIINCRMKAIENLETDATNLHSFFVGDLEKAKTIESSILDDYILKRRKERVNLDSRVKSSEFDSKVFSKILQPKNYPTARFPSNPEYSLTFMQQVAVNLAIGYDNEQIRSVNGPPGTGKTTLLKDIFAELVVEQSYDIARLSKKYIKGSEETKYWNNASIGIMPKKIAEKGIVVASSNNGAVQNIVNELPLLTGIDKKFSSSLIKVDYFKIIANSNVSSKWVEDENGTKHEELVSKENKENNKFWGLFSLEGGRKENMDYIVKVLKHVVSYLEKEYEPDEEIYQKFMNQYKDVCLYREERQKISETINKLNKLLVEIGTQHDLYVRESANRKKEIEEEKASTLKITIDIQDKIETLKDSLQELSDLQFKQYEERECINQCIDALKLQKPGIFSSIKRKREYKEKCKLYSNQLQKIILSEHSYKAQIMEHENKIKSLLDTKSKKETELKCKIELFDKLTQKAKADITYMEKHAEELKKSIDEKNINKLDFTIDYETLQLSNPWFDTEYRNLQSELFISALKVRKQFLYDNVKNIKAAYIIWNKQRDYLCHKMVISEAWNWINMVIPVISSTFASFSRMCFNMGENTIGHLFIDEAGQALPQAGVGAIFRSRNVMVVGDPSQIKPVLTLDSSLLDMLGKYYGVSKFFLSSSASVQTLVDEISKYGFYKDNTREEWIGIPLWVHRRCKYPMFDIANKISYGGNMVQAEKKNGKSEWFDICGSAVDKYVEEQGKFLREKIQKMIFQNADIIDKEKKDIIYVITPFKNVAYHLSQELRKIGFTRYDEKGKPTNVGTVHTFQGKEAPIVFLVLGADEKSKGAANWAMGTENPNIMNVAATRAKEEFYIIGNKKLYLELKSDVINETNEIINKFNK